MAGLASDDRSGDRARGSLQGQLSSAASAVLEDERALAERDQTLADSDQLAADRDQAASGRDLATGGNAVAHEASRGAREQSADQREHNALAPERSARARLQAAEHRDAIADDRDVAAMARDYAAEARDRAMAQCDATAQDDDERCTGSERVVRAAGARKRAMQRRAQAAEYRALAASDRRLAEQDREQAARERRRARVDRQALARELQRERQRRDEAQRHEHHAAEKLVGTLQRSLCPPRLPQIAGFDIAVHYQPSSAQHAGGVFYDLFALATGRSGFFVGDVCATGPQAAAVASLARYTMRSAAAVHDEPAAVLLDLDAALRTSAGDTPQTCTAVYADIGVRSDGAAISLTVAGHLVPLIVRAHGAVEATPARGTLLGAVDDPMFESCEIQLAAGDTIIIYTDGILDATIDRIEVDEQRVAELVLGAPHASAHTLVDRLVRAVRRVDRPLRDDVAIIALRRTSN